MADRPAARRERRPKSATPAERSPAAREWLVPLAALLALLGVLVTQYAGALSLPLMTDDYLILSRVRGASFGSLWSPVELLMGFYRPWGRELHFWAMDRMFGAQPLAFHLAGFALWLAALACFYTIVRTLACTRAAVLATCLAATPAGWGALLIWAAGSQDLCMMAAGMICLAAFVRGHSALAAAALAVSLLSKEAAASLPPIAFLYALIVERRRLGEALRRTAWLWAVLGVWVLFHPLLGGVLHRSSSPVDMRAAWDGPAKLVATVRSLASADIALQPADGWSQALSTGIPAALLLAMAVLIAFRVTPASRAATEPAGELPRATRVAAWAGCWALLGWLPAAMPGLSWHAYYALWGSFGVWIVAALLLQRMPWAGIALVVALALIRPARAQTPQVDLGSEWYHGRAGMLTGAVQSDLLGHRPTLPSHSRVFLAGLPGGVGLMPSPGKSPALEAWYGDHTLRGYFFSQYTPRAPGDTLGKDFFFLFDSTGHSSEIIMGPEDLSRAQHDPGWQRRHLELAALLYDKGDIPGCAAELAKVVVVTPDDPSLLMALGACYEGMGNKVAADRWFARAFTLPGASLAMLAGARHDWGGPGTPALPPAR